MTEASSPQTVFMSERIERDAWLDQFAAVPASYPGGERAHYNRFGCIGALAHVDIPITELNRAWSIMGASIDELAAARDWLDQNAMPGWAIQIPDVASADLTDWLETNGFVAKGNGWAKFHSTAQQKLSPEKVDVRQVPQADAELFGYVVQAGFGLPTDVIPWFASLVGRPNWSTYLAYDQGEAMACGAMYADGRWAWLGIDATLEQHRGKGAQKSIISRRMLDGVMDGVTDFTAETGRVPDGSGEVNISHENYLKSGFAVLSVRPNYVCDTSQRR